MSRSNLVDGLTMKWIHRRWPLNRRVNRVQKRGPEGRIQFFWTHNVGGSIVPKDYLGDVIGSLSSRRGKIVSVESRPGSEAINAEVPLAEMFGYATDLRSKTQGRAAYTMQFLNYNAVSEGMAKDIIEKRSSRKG